MLKQRFNRAKIVLKSLMLEFKQFYNCDVNLCLNFQMSIFKIYSRLETN